MCRNFPDEFKSVSRSALVAEQERDSSVKQLFDMLVLFVEIDSSSHGYFLHGGLLFRKWVPQGEFFVGGPVCQFVTPRKFHNLVLHICHDNLTEHPMINKTHDQVLQ